MHDHSPMLREYTATQTRGALRNPWRAAASLLACSLLPAPATAQQADDADGATEPKQRAAIADPLRFVSQHSGTFAGRTVRYQAVASETYLYDGDEHPKASIFSFAYLAQPPEGASARPVAFVWNGGPGSSSVWLHMGTFGPKRVVVPSDARDDGAPPYPIQSNDGTVLDLVDLVFVDPVGTGYSRPLGDHEGEEFWGLEADAESIAEFIRVWVTEHGRWNAPKFLIGESFGTTRAAAVAELLEGRGENLSLNGLILISQALDYQGSTPAHDNLRSYLTYLPTMAATAWYHGKVEREGVAATLEGFLAEVRRFVYEEYGPALLRGSSLDSAARSSVRDQLADFLGLSPDYVERSDLRVLADRFRKELLRSDGLAVGRIDGRYAGDDIDDVAERPEGDASSYGISGAYAAALHEVMRADLGIEIAKRRYNVSGPSELGQNWSWRPQEGGYWEPSYVNVTRRLATAMRRNPELRVLVANGYYDFATPFFDAEITFDRHGIARDRVEFTYYEAGHMMYLHHPSNERFLADVRAFLERALND